MSIVRTLVLTGFLLVAVALTSSKPPAPGFEPYALGLLGIAGVIGGIAGALTDSLTMPTRPVVKRGTS